MCTSLWVMVAGSVVNSPTISSRMSSSVTSPSMSPYSLTTNAKRRRLRWKCAELHVECRALGHEVGLAPARDLDEPLARELAAHQLVRDALHVQQADEVVELALVHRQPRVRGLAQLRRGCPPSSRSTSMPADLLARHHDVVHRDAPEVEDRQQHLAVARRDQRARPRSPPCAAPRRSRSGRCAPRAPRRTAAGTRRRACW